ncbi:hypothetical protein CORT_0B04770 [Candida orthopsilosis Co 90-125]|uniref:NAD(P)-binding protein n=1 Tax=Candida orthopsilosis (strain 90-125) TaxID=1136231 RepID=H8X1E5_CANO9|nr:hypothetical protein CORT_0B04770 [Candida orthopsilosis Co 90-125]CCG22185.1 hypothetical protein CORT_0B04770 [Candida orthopsilosis Co 90-125]
MSYPDIPRNSLSDLKQLAHGMWATKPTFKEDQYPSLEGKVVIVTGGNTGLGYETVKSLAGSTKARIYIFSRSKEKTLNAINDLKLEVQKEYGVHNREIGFIQVDLSDLTTIKPAVEEFLKKENRLDIIINNAGVMMPPQGSKTKQGYELQIGTNALGHHLLQRLLDPICIKTSETNPPGLSRIVWLSSTAHMYAPRGGIHWDDIGFKKVPRFTSNVKMQLYGQSKAANLIQARTWSRKHGYPNVISSSICPGYLNTDLQRHASAMEKYVYKYVLYPQRMGAYTELYAALSPDVKDGDHSISFGTPGKGRKDLLNDEVGDKLWDWLDKETDPYV